MRYGQAECEHGTPGGDPTTCALCRCLAQRAERVAQWTDVAMLAAGDRG